MPVAHVNGVKLHYVQFDDGAAGVAREDLIMVHGLATNMAFWFLPYTPVFAKRFRVTLFDMRGFGRSEMSPGGYTPQNLSLDLAALMDHLGIGSAHFVAHSFGGVVALNLACREPKRVQSLVLADSHISAVRHSGPEREWGNRAHVQALVDRNGLALNTHDPYFGFRLLTEVAHRRLRQEAVPQELLALGVPMMGQSGKRTAQQWLSLVGETAAERELMGDDGLTLKALHRLRFPILALYGDNSQARLTGGDLLDVWPHAEFRRVRDAGHFFPASRPDDVIRECERFWSGEYENNNAVRSGESHKRHFRSDRVFKADGAWHFTTRETKRVGPFATSDAAREALARYMSGTSSALA